MHISPNWLKLRKIIATLFVVYCMIIISRVPSYLGIYIAMVQYLSVALLFTLLLHFLTPRKEIRAVEWWDALPLILCLPGIIFNIFFYNKVLDYQAYGFLDLKGAIFAFSLAVGLLITVYRRTTWAITVLVAVILLMTHFQNYLPGLLHGAGYGWKRLGYSFYAGSHGIFGIPFRIASTILIGFIIFGRLFQAAGGGKWFLNLAIALFGRVRGGIAGAAVMASAFFGMISGSPSANTATTGAITIPMMKEAGYKNSFAGAVEAVASTGGQFMPPVMGAIIFIMAEWLDLSYATVAFAGAIPAALYFLIVFVSVYLEALKSDRPIIVHSKTTSIGHLLKDGWFYIIPFTVLIVFLLVLEYDPGQAALLSVCVLIPSSFLSNKTENKLYLKKIWNSLALGVETWLTVGTITATVGMIIGALTLSGLGVKLSGFLVDLCGSNIFLMLIMVGVASLVLGMGLDSIPCYMTVAILTVPALMKIGVPAIAAHLFVIYWGLASFITPPVCLAVFVACGISGGGIWQTGGNAIRLGMGAFLISFAFVLSPALLLMGSLIEIIVAVLMTMLGAFAVTSGLIGYCLKSLNWFQRAALLCGGVLIIYPAFCIKIVGLIIAAASLFWQWLEKRHGNVAA